VEKKMKIGILHLFTMTDFAVLVDPLEPPEEDGYDGCGADFVDCWKENVVEQYSGCDAVLGRRLCRTWSRRRIPPR
jgi:hypothetical protein